MDENSDLISIKGLAAMCRVSVPTIYRILKYGRPKHRKHAGSVDFRSLDSVCVGWRRYWKRSEAQKALDEARAGKGREYRPKGSRKRPDWLDDEV